MQSYLESVGEERRRSFHRALALSAAGHALLLLLYVFGPRPHQRLLLPAVVQVDLVAAPAALARPRPAAHEPEPAKPLPPKPTPKPKPAPPKPPPRHPAKVVLPEKPTPPKAAPRPEPEHAAEESESYADLLAKLRKEEGEPAKAEPPATAASAEHSAAPGGLPVAISAETRVWMKKAKLRVTQAWILQPGFRTLPLETEIRVRLGPSGEILDAEVTRSSGNPWYDESVERAIRKASPLPPPPEAGDWSFVFRPGDLL